MIDWLVGNHFQIAKALHIIAVISWMAGIFYLPRLFVYHCEALPGTAEEARFQTMERKLLRVIMNPAMIVTWLAGLWMVVSMGASAATAGWLHVKLLFVLGITGFHMMCARWRKAFAAGENKHTARFFRMVNEVPTLAMIVIVVLVVFKPFA